MKIMKKKGFTLVELLGVIILLGVIVLLITPNILKVQKKSEKDLFEASVNSLLRSAQLYYANNNFINYPTSGIAANSPDLDAKNNINFNSGMIKLVNKEYFYADNVTNGNYCAVGVRNDLTITKGACPETPDRCFDFDEQTGTITKFRRDKVGCDITNPTVPEKINGIIVKKIGYAAFTEPQTSYCSKDDFQTGSLKDSNYIPNEEENEECLINPKNGYVGLVSVNLPSTLEYIGQNAFAFNNISTIDFTTMPNLSYIGSCSFMNNNLKIVDLTNNKKLKLINMHSFSNNINLSSVKINDLPELEKIRQEAFYKTNIETLNLSNLPNLSIIETYAFSNAHIQNINFTNLNNLEIIDEYAFEVENLNDVEIKNLPKLKNIKKYAFSGSGIDNLVLENLPSLISIDDFAFYNNAIVNLNMSKLPELDSIEQYAFRNNRMKVLNLKNLPKLSYLGIWSFASCGIGELNLYNLPNLYIIDSYAFHGNGIGGTVDFSQAPNLYGIGSQGFYCNGIKNIIFNNPNLKTIGNYGFLYSPTESMNLEDTGLESIGNGTFSRAGFSSVTLPASLKTIGYGAFGKNTSLKSVTVLGDDPKRFNSSWTSYGFSSDLMKG